MLDAATLTHQIVSPHTTRRNNNQAKTKYPIECNPLPSRHRVVPRNDARQRDRIKITDSRDHPRQDIHGIAVRKARVLGSQSILDVERHPVGPQRPAVQKQHDAKGNGVGDGEADGEPDAPVPLLRVGAGDEAAVEEQDRDFGGTAADQKGELREPHAEHGAGAEFGPDVPDVAATVCFLRENDGDGCEC
jgi:hypothetical protein